MQNYTFLKTVKKISFLFLLISFGVTASVSVKKVSYFIPAPVSNQQNLSEIIILLDNNVSRSFVRERAGELLIDGKYCDLKEIVLFLKSNFSADTRNLEIDGCEFAKGLNGLSVVYYIENELSFSISASTNAIVKGGDWNIDVVNKQLKSLNFEDYNGNLQFANFLT